MEAFSVGLIRAYEPVAEVARYTLYPDTAVDVLGFHQRSTSCWTVAPDPVAVSDVVPEFDVKKEMLAEVDPAAVGANVTVKGAL